MGERGARRFRHRRRWRGCRQCQAARCASADASSGVRRAMSRPPVDAQRAGQSVRNGPKQPDAVTSTVVRQRAEGIAGCRFGAAGGRVPGMALRRRSRRRQPAPSRASRAPPAQRARGQGVAFEFTRHAAGNRVSSPRTAFTATPLRPAAGESVAFPRRAAGATRPATGAPAAATSGPRPATEPASRRGSKRRAGWSFRVGQVRPRALDHAVADL